jgi:polysaccharide pyruvyl transferase WcaK-like protein
VSPPAAEPREILLLDLWSERNRGDAAMQVALVQLVRERLPASRVTAMAAFGANQWPALRGEFDETGPLVDDFVGGIRPWLLGPFQSGPLSFPVVRKVVSGGYAFMAFWMLLLCPILSRAPILDALLPRSRRRSVAALRSADLVLWNCRNIRGDSAMTEPYQVWGRTYNALAAILFRKPVACIGASIWPLRNPLSRAIARYVLGRCVFVSVRDSSSYEYARSLLHDKSCELHLLPDLSLSLLARSSTLVRQLPSEPLTLGLTVVDDPKSGATARRAYIAALRGYLKEFLGRDGTTVALIPQVTTAWQPTAGLEADLLSGLDPTRVRREDGRPTIHQLTAMYGKVDFLIATRMHSAIIALTQGTPVVAIPYVAGGKWGILDMMGANDVAIPFVGIDADGLERKIESVWRRRQEMLASVATRLPVLAREVEENVAIPVRIFESRADGAGMPARRRRGAL